MADKYDIKCILFRIGEKGKTSHKAINYESFVKTLNSPIIQQRLKDGLLLGLLTHCDRDKARQSRIPHHDMVMRDPDLCNIMRKVTVKDGVVYGYMDLTDTDAARRVKSLWKQGCKLGVSISTELVEKDEFYITEWFGTDITLRPEFDTPIIEGNFSELPPNEKLEPSYAGFSVGKFEVDPSEQVLAGDFSENPTKTVTEDPTAKISNVDFSAKEEGENVSTCQGDFSVRDYLRERAKKPSQVLKARIKDVIMYMRMARPRVVNENKSYLRRYILEYVNEWITVAASDPKVDLNLAFGLRLNDYCKNRNSMRQLQMSLRRAKEQMNGQGTMTRQTQADINKYFSEVIGEVFNYINEKVDNKDKKI